VIHLERFPVADQIAKCCDFIVESLLQVPTLFGRLVLVASAWDPNSKAYHHSDIELEFARETTHGAFEKLHWEAFRRWMSLTDSQRKGDLAQYMDSAKLGESAMVELWINSQRYRELVPEDASVPERQAFARELATLLISLAAERHMSESRRW
jgi:hypothetical protein